MHNYMQLTPCLTLILKRIRFPYLPGNGLHSPKQWYNKHTQTFFALLTLFSYLIL